MSELRQSIYFNINKDRFTIMKCLFNINKKFHIVYKLASINNQDKINKLMFADENSCRYVRSCIYEKKNDLSFTFSYPGEFKFIYNKKSLDNEETEDKSISIELINNIISGEQDSNNSKLFIIKNNQRNLFFHFMENKDKYIQAISNAYNQIFPGYHSFKSTFNSLTVIKNNLDFLVNMNIPQDYKINNLLFSIIKTAASFDVKKSIDFDTVFKTMKCGALTIDMKKKYGYNSTSNSNWKKRVYLTASYLNDSFLNYVDSEEFINDPSNKYKRKKEILSYLIDNYKTGNAMLQRMKKNILKSMVSSQ